MEDRDPPKGWGETFRSFLMSAPDDADLLDADHWTFSNRLRYDEQTTRYWSLVNKEKNPTAYRNILTLISSADLRNWKVESILVRHVDDRHHAWQYPDWLFDADDLIAASRTAWDDSHRAHDANYLTFHRIEGSRKLTRRPTWAAGRKSSCRKGIGLVQWYYCPTPTE